MKCARCYVESSYVRKGRGGRPYCVGCDPNTPVGTVTCGKSRGYVWAKSPALVNVETCNRIEAYLAKPPRDPKPRKRSLQAARAAMERTGLAVIESGVAEPYIAPLGPDVKRRRANTPAYTIVRVLYESEGGEVLAMDSVPLSNTEARSVESDFARRDMVVETYRIHFDDNGHEIGRSGFHVGLKARVVEVPRLFTVERLPDEPELAPARRSYEDSVRAFEAAMASLNATLARTAA